MTNHLSKLWWTISFHFTKNVKLYFWKEILFFLINKGSKVFLIERRPPKLPLPPSQKQFLKRKKSSKSLWKVGFPFYICLFFSSIKLFILFWLLFTCSFFIFFIICLLFLLHLYYIFIIARYTLLNNMVLVIDINRH